ncbi:MAG: GNAT family N-acetyltransferase [Candidatus Aminicenantes bacterium]|nr:GNAT family N-acetyltransferase [Candidatus Aminicenantes bacterium]
MDVHRLDQIFEPQRIALIGVSTNPNSVGGKVLSNLVGGGFRGVVYPVNPSAEAVMGIPCFPNVKNLPKVPDLGIICAPAPEVPDLIEECGRAGINGIIILSAGFRETGPEGKALEDRIKKKLKKFDGMRIIGPNCLGVIAPDKNLNASFAAGMPKKGRIAFISQSGALCTSVLDWAEEEEIGFSYFVSIGNTLDVSYGDLIDYFGEDEGTDSIILYIESIENARKFMAAARAFARTKPIVAYKAGRFPESAAVAASHTGAMASEDAVYGAAFQRVGLARVYDIGEIFDVAELIGRNKIPKGPRLGIITNAGGPGVMATDALIASDGILAELSGETLDTLDKDLPPMWSRGNPVDVLGDARSKRILKACQTVLKDKGVDALLVILTPQAMTNPTRTAELLGEQVQKTRKPVLTAWLGGKTMKEGIQLLNKEGVPTYKTPEQAVRAFMTLVDYSKNLQSLYETPKDIPVTFSLDREKLRAQFDKIIAEKGPVFTEDASKNLLETYGIPIVPTEAAATADQAAELADKMGYPVVLKILSPQIIHKTDVGGVVLSLKNASQVKKAFLRITESARKKNPDAEIKGVTVQPMLKPEHAVEMILGTKKDPIFGTIILAGSGGITTELFHDTSLGFPPLNEKLALRMLESLKIWPLLHGYRGRPPVHMERLIEILIRLSYLAADYPEISELDINPLLVGPKDIVALDARVVIDEEKIGKTIKPYSHLALHPYPEEYVREAKLRDGRQIFLRPIKPEDEPLWFDLLRSCSRESIYYRFRYFFHWDSHEVASRYCFIDYDREIAIVPEIEEGNKRRLLGVGRLVADPDHETVEYAVLIGDEWQNQGLGGILTDYCIEISRDWGLKEMAAITTSDNKRMLAIFQKRGFKLEFDPSSSLVRVSKLLKNSASARQKKSSPKKTSLSE